MVSSRVQITFTGAPAFLAVSTASATKSVCERRPKPPPRKVVCTCTRSRGTPAISAATFWVELWSWVGAHTSTAPSPMRAVQFMGSMQAWARKGTWYPASTVRAAPASAPPASPSLWAVAASPLSAASRSWRSIPAEESPLCSP